MRDSDIDDKQFYAQLVRAQLSSQEQLLLFYNCLHPVGENFKPLIEEFEMLEHLPKDRLLDEAHVKLYNPPAFGVPEPF